MKITIEMSDEQAYTIQDALELYSRVLIGQIDIVNEVVRRELGTVTDYRELETLANKLKDGLFPELTKYRSYGIPGCKSIRARVAWEIMTCIRNSMAWYKHPEGGNTVNFDPPTQYSNEPLIKIIIKEMDK